MIVLWEGKVMGAAVTACAKRTAFSALKRSKFGVAASLEP